ncbi:MAG: hypothetical protein KDA86_06160 [Planctomycetaceae bacterium]|nr:hypothetical protein [Planctomycetaceae bacterium]
MMNTLNNISLAALFSIALASVAAADEPTVVVGLPRPTFGSGVVAPVVGGYGYHRTGAAASTAHESILRGRADVIRAQGEQALLIAEALRSYEEAKSRFLDNEVKRLAVRQERRRMGLADQHERFAKYQARRETTMALNRAAREIQATYVPAEQITETHAQTKLRLAKNLLINGRIDSGISGLVEVTQKYTNTDAAEEAAAILTEING